MVEQQPSKLNTRVRFPSPAPGDGIEIIELPIARNTTFRELVAEMVARDVRSTKARGRAS